MSHSLALFQQVYIINLASRVDRRAEMTEQLRRIGLNIDSPNVRLFEAVRPPDAGAFTSTGARGCFMSHLGVLRDARSAGLERILILEDDLNFSVDFLARAPSLIDQLAAQDWSIFYGGHELHGAPPQGVGALLIEPALHVQTAHFVAFRGAAIAALASYLEAMLTRKPGDRLGGPMHVDGAYCWFRAARPELNTVIAQPPLGYQRSSRTDIHQLRWFDKVPLVRALVVLLRRARNRYNLRTAAK